ncbi:hypothetical protein C7416_103582 [Cupriavidus phytorum]|uniref:Uncharacterized protein n=1 Tax=Cupriavidus phytorum TaxID=3024399 RepID=A0A2W7PQ93_9BURK|nr:hypothetical protein [Cupriavidus alkaliphilus]PZX30849.1 hypothetical protein C7416_103582 [Cupriavidus alkaliphilus]
MMRRHHSAFQWREYTERAPGLYVCVGHWYGGEGFALSSERRITTAARPGRVQCVRGADAGELLAAVAALAQDIAADPPPSLRIVTCDNLDNGVTARAVLLLLAAMQSDDEQQEAA